MRYVPVLLLLAACAPSPQAPVQVVALVSKQAGVYEPDQVQLNTIKDLVGMKGDVATFIGGARIVLDPGDPTNLSDDAYAKFITKNEGGDVHVNFIEKDGVYWPADFDSWNLVTSYYNFEKANEYFVATGIASSELQGSTVYYAPELLNRSVSADPIKDNAFFVQPLRAFVLTQLEKHEKVPFPLNLGVIVHEFSHKVWNRRVYGGSGNPEAFARWLGGGISGAANLLKSMDEGFADYHAYGATCLQATDCDPRFVSSSLDDERAAPRDISVTNRCLSTNDRTVLEMQGFGQFLSTGGDYRVGTVLAAALYQAGEKTGKREDLQRALIETYSDETPANLGFRQLVTQNLASPEKFKLETVANALLGHITDTELRRQTCNQLWPRLKLDVLFVPNCPASSAPVQDCVGVP